jgi:CO/xanthine dehydrogenase Mo-binding subunit
MSAPRLEFLVDGTVTVRIGKVEIGQGIVTAMAQIAADALDLPLSSIRIETANTVTGPDEGVTAGSLSVQDAGATLRQVCEEARRDFAENLSLRPGWPAAGAKTNSDQPVVGSSVPRFDLLDKFIGRPRFIHDLSLPGLLYGRVARPPSPGAQLLEVDLQAVQALPGVVATVRNGRFLGVVADSEYAAVKALAVLARKAQWQETQTLPPVHALADYLRSQPHETSVYAEKLAPPEPPSAQVTGSVAGPAVRSFKASYSRPFLAHASIGPSCAAAVWRGQGVEVWSHSQAIYNLRADLSKMLNLPEQDIVVRHVEGAGCYGHNGADDVAADAVLLAQAVSGRAVLVQWTREDEMSWSPLGAAMVADLQAEVDAQGRIVNWQHAVISTGHSSRPGRWPSSVLLAATHCAGAPEMPLSINMPLANGGGAQRNSVPVYNFPAWRAVNHRVMTMPLRTSSLRSLGAHCNVFAAESFMDEIATALEIDPLVFRLNHLDDTRTRAVLEKAAEMAAWSDRQPESGQGMGLAVSRYKNTGSFCAVVALIDAGRELRVKKLWIAVDVGQVVNPDGVRNQIEGGAIQTVSWVLKEAVQFDQTRVQSSTWDTYPILRFSEVPEIEIHLIDRPDLPSLGAGEATQGPVAAAIANALAHALGVRVREMPITVDAVAKAAWN